MTSPGACRPVHLAFADELHAVTRRAAAVVARCAIALVPFFALLDVIVFPGHAAVFLLGRAITVLLAIAVLVLVRRTTWGARHALLLGVSIPIAIGLHVDAMTMLAGREASPYYVGIIVVLLAASLILPWRPALAFGTSTLLIGVYAAGIALTGPIDDLPRLLTNLFLLAATAVLVVVGAAVHAGLRRREFESRWALDGHARRQEAAATLGRDALRATATGELMQRAVVLVAETLGVDLAKVLELQPDGSLRLQAGVGWRPGLVGRARVGGGMESQAGFTLQAEHPVIVEDLRRETRFTGPSLLHEHGVVSGVSVVVWGRDRPYGVLGVHSTTARIFTTKEVDFLQTIAGTLTTAVVREQADRALAEEADVSGALARVGQVLISSLDSRVILDRLCTLTAEALGCDYSTTWLWEKTEQRLVPIAGHVDPPEVWESVRALHLGGPEVARLVDALTHTTMLQLAITDRPTPFIREVLAHYDTPVVLCLALRHGDDLIGVQTVAARGRHEDFTTRQRRIAQGVAQLASAALANARLHEELEQASRLKSEFVSTMSHELRTPLNVIVGYTEMLAEDLDRVERDRALAQVRRSSLELLELIEATLDTSRITSGKDTACLEDVPLAPLCAELQAEFSTLKRTAGVVLRWPDCGHTVLHTDRRKLKIVLKNLLGNALKFTPAGEIELRVERGHDAWRLVVRDTGIGIAPQHLPSIFEMFRQVDSSDSRSYGGIGLGLYIVRKLVDQLGGEITVASTPGEGTTFTVVLPLLHPPRLASASA